MSKVVVFVSLTLDGVMQGLARPDEDTLQPGPLAPLGKQEAAALPAPWAAGAAGASGAYTFNH